MELKACRAILNRGGTILDINMELGNALRGLFTGSYKIVFGSQTAETLQTLADLASQGKITFDIGQTVPLESAIKLIADQEQGRRRAGKLVIDIGARASGGTVAELFDLL